MGDGDGFWVKDLLEVMVHDRNDLLDSIDRVSVFRELKKTPDTSSTEDRWFI